MEQPSDPSGPSDSDLKRAIRENRDRFQWLGASLIVVGVLAILFPLFASIAVKLMVGWFFLLTGAVTLWHAFQSRTWQPAALSGLIGILHLAIGVYLAFFPLTGLIGLTALLAIVFAVQGVVEGMLAWRHRPGHGQEGPGWALMGVSGAISVFLAVLLVAGLPGTALWAIGVIFGINCLSSGLSFVALARAAKSF